MKETVGQLKKEITTLNANHEKQLERLTRAEIRIAQGLVLAMLMSITLPTVVTLLITMLSPRLQIGAPSNQYPMEHRR